MTVTTSTESGQDHANDNLALQIRGITAGYERSTVLHDVNIEVSSGSVVALIGANGAGKTTLLRTTAGLIKPTAGEILLDGLDVTKWPEHRRSGNGLCLIPEGRGVFRALTVSENLRIQLPRKAPRNAIEKVIDVFPILGQRLSQRAGTLSGGEQQMLALSRAYLCNPKVVLLDELSMGLAPVIVQQIFASIRKLADEGISMLIVEQYIDQVLALADNVVILTRGKVSFSGPKETLDRDAVLRGYLSGDGN